MGARPAGRGGFRSLRYGPLSHPACSNRELTTCVPSSGVRNTRTPRPLSAVGTPPANARLSLSRSTLMQPRSTRVRLGPGSWAGQPGAVGLISGPSRSRCSTDVVISGMTTAGGDRAVQQGEPRLWVGSGPPVGRHRQLAAAAPTAPPRLGACRHRRSPISGCSAVLSVAGFPRPAGTGPRR